MLQDGTDCPISEPRQFSAKWYSHKRNGAALRYEVAASVGSAKIVWASGPWAPGLKQRHQNFQARFEENSSVDEFVIIYAGYGDTRCIVPSVERYLMSATLAALRARHEIVNGQLKNFRVLSSLFRLALNLHRECFFAVLNVVSIALSEAQFFSIQ